MGRPGRVGPRQLQRWPDGTKPSSDGLCTLVKLGTCIPGGLYILQDLHDVLPPVGTLQPPLATGFGLDERKG